jgi:hypothetical protein
MKRLILTLAMISSLTALQAQNRMKRDTTNKIVNPDDFKTDSVKRGQEVFLPGKNQPDTTMQKQKPKKKAASNKEATKPK